MKVMISSYNEGIEDWNAEAQETAAYAYKLDHKLDEPCEAWVYLRDDKLGTKAQKYNADVNDNYLGTSKLYIEDPNGTDVFYGRIVRAEASTQNTVVLYCRDFLDQLNDPIISKDMREDLDGSGLRESSLLPDWDETDGVGGIRPAYDAGGGVIYVYDNHRVLTADAHINKFLTFSNKIAGKNTWTTGPYDAITTNGGVETGDESDMWDDDDANGYSVIDNDASWTQDVLFRVLLGDETATINANYVADSLTGARVRVTYSFASTVLDDLCDIQIHVDTNADGTPDAYKTIGQLKLYDSVLGSIKEREAVFTIPKEMFDGSVGDQIVNTAGVARVRFNVVWGSGVTTLTIYKIEFEVDCSTTGMSDIATIADNETYKLTVNVDFADPTKKVWTGCQYSVAREIYKHIDSGETPGNLITAYDLIVSLTCAATIEHTSGVSFKKYVDKSPLYILKDLARQDKAHFWIAAGGSTVTWKSTFGAATETLTDAEILSIQMVQDYDELYNSVTVYGMRIANDQLTSTQTDATSIDTFNITRAKILSGESGLTNTYDCATRATVELARTKDMQKKVPMCTLRGNTLTAAHANTIKLGDVVTLNSTYLGVNAAYIVQQLTYDSRQHMTTLFLHPHLSQIGLQPLETQSKEQAFSRYRRGSSEVYIPPNTSEVG